MPGFLDAQTPEQRWAITDYIVSLSGENGPGYTNLVVARHVQDPIDLAKGAASFASAPAARFPIVGQIMEPGRAFHPPTTSVTVQAIYDAESIALLVRWHDMSAEKTGKNGPSLPVPPEEEALGPGRCRAAGRRGPLRRGGSGAGAGGCPAARKGPVRRGGSGASRPAIRVLRRSLDPDSLAGADRRPEAVLHLRRSPRTRWISGSSIWRAPSRSNSPAGEAADIAANDTGDLTGVASYDQGEWSVIFKRPLRATSGAPFLPGQFLPVAFSVWDGLSRERGNRRGLTIWYSLYVEPEVVPSAFGPMLKTALFILAIELAVIGWVRWRYGARAREERGGEPRQPAATRA